MSISVSSAVIRLTDDNFPELTLTYTDGSQLRKFVDVKDLGHSLLRDPQVTPPSFIPPNIVASNGDDIFVQFIPPSCRPLLFGIADQLIPLMIPLPPLLLFSTSDTLRFAAVKSRPESADEPLFVVPLPNISSLNGSVCWGGNAPRCSELYQTDSILAEFFGTVFSSHGASDKCVSHPEDVRLLLSKLNGLPEFPLEELLPMENRTLRSWSGLR